MLPPCLESQGCHLIPLCYLLSCSSAQFCYPFCLIVFCLLALSSKLFPENSSIFFVKRQAFCMAPVQRLGEDSWSVVCAACCHMTLVFAVMHLYNILRICYCFCPFLFYTFLKSGIDKSTEWSMIPACPSLMSFFNRDDTEGTNSSKILCPMFVYVLFYVNLCHD